MNLIEKIRIATNTDEDFYDPFLLEIFLFGEMGEALHYFKSSAHPKFIERMINKSLKSMWWRFDAPSKLGTHLAKFNGERILRLNSEDMPFAKDADILFHKNTLLAAGFITSEEMYYPRGATESIFEEFHDPEEIFMDDFREEIATEIRLNARVNMEVPYEYSSKYFLGCTYQSRYRYHLEMAFDYFMNNEHPKLPVSQEVEEMIEQFCVRQDERWSSANYKIIGDRSDIRSDTHALAWASGFVPHLGEEKQLWINYLDHRLRLFRFCK